MNLFLSRLRLRRDAPAHALAPLLLPAGQGERLAATHRLLWTLFSDATARDFLWREDRNGWFYALSLRPPEDRHALFELEFKRFDPTLAAGERLRFALRANAVVQRAVPGGRSRPHDLVMDALKPLPREARPGAREAVAAEQARAWLLRQGAAHGFEPETVVVLGYDRVALPRQRDRPAVFGVLDLEGELTLRDPALFLARLAAGFGRARAFGCGLMLIRRA